jgi:hypothetical protein
MRKSKLAAQQRKYATRVKVTAATRKANRLAKKQGPSALRRKAARVKLQPKAETVES